MKKMIMTSVALILSFAALGTLSACNTVDGIGADVESAGRSIQNAF